jgi:hypothetical protein
MVPLALDLIDAVADEPSLLPITARYRFERLLLVLGGANSSGGPRISWYMEAKERIRKEIVDGSPRAIPSVG